jgi:hypothetical protein
VNHKLGSEEALDQTVSVGCRKQWTRIVIVSVSCFLVEIYWEGQIWPMHGIVAWLPVVIIDEQECVIGQDSQIPAKQPSRLPCWPSTRYAKQKDLLKLSNVIHGTPPNIMPQPLATMKSICLLLLSWDSSASPMSTFFGMISKH